MSQLSRTLRDATDGMLIFQCPGCGMSHGVTTGEGPGPRWQWNGDIEKPTFLPSILVTFPANPDANEEFKEWRTERRCHSFVTDGRIRFLGDCTHSLAGKTVDLPDWNGWREPA